MPASLRAERTRSNVTRQRVEPDWKESASRISPWCNSIAKRLCDLLGAGLLLAIFALPMLLLAMAVKMTSRGPIIFRQGRRGKNGREFYIFKFRTMIVSDNAGPALTRAQDPRVTWFGRRMRRWKLDELPQLFNVVRGEMSFVGPRPHVSRLWNDPSLGEKAYLVLSVRPGITSEATVMFRHEERVLAALTSDEVETVYLRALMPLKLDMEMQYLKSATLISDLKIMLRTVGKIFDHRAKKDEMLNKQLLVINKARRNVEQVWSSPEGSA